MILYISYLQILEGISDIRDESDRSGMRIVIEVCTDNLHICVLLILAAKVIAYTFILGAKVAYLSRFFC